jgi:hypothetical protein
MIIKHSFLTSSSRLLTKFILSKQKRGISRHLAKMELSVIKTPLSPVPQAGRATFEICDIKCENDAGKLKLLYDHSRVNL